MGIIKNLPDNEKPREKAFLFGVEKLTNAELLAVLLCTGSYQEDAIQLAETILSECKTIENLSRYTLQELSSFKGVKIAKAVKIKAALELHFRIEKEKHMKKVFIHNIQDAARYLKAYNRNAFQECLMLLLLDKKQKLIAIKTIARGNDEMVSLSINNIISTAIKGCAKKFIIAHNHPSNVCNPSLADDESSRRLLLTSSLVGVELLDHLIITDDEYYSIFEKRKYLF